jgi:peptidyl-prolyl cis-trans isomerase B (cyclophilin B)
MDDKKPTATIEMELGGEIVIELDPTNAPNTVKNFIALANSGFYDGLTFHRVIPGFMIQGGCPEGFGTGNPGYRIKGEFKANGHENKLKHKRGVISMARAQPNDSAGCQFFIMDQDSTHLDGQYAAFGMVQQGFEVIDRIVAVATDPHDKPLEKQTIKSITVETHGAEYEPPETL